MRISKRAKYVLAVPAFVVASVVTQFTQVIPTYAATLTWTGGGDGTTFSDAANWNTGVIPGDGDAVTFSYTGLSANTTLNNDITDLDLVGITFNGTASTYYTYTIGGNALNVQGSISNSVTGSNASFATPTINTALTLTGSTIATAVNLNAVNTAGFGLTVGGAQDCGINVSGNITGAGGLTVSGTNINIRGNNTYTGATSVTGTASFATTGFGAASAGTTVSGSGSLTIVSTSNTTVGEPFTFGGTGTLRTSQNFQGCSGGDGPVSTLTLNGGVVLASDYRFSGVNNLVVTAPYNANGHNFTVAGGSTGTLTTPQGSVEVPSEEIVLDGDQNTTFVNIGNKQTGVLNGTRGDISVQAGGTLKGTGSAASIYIMNGAFLKPGNSPGTITAREAVGISGQYEVEIQNKDNYDKVITGEAFPDEDAVYLMSGSSLNVVLYDGWKITNGDTFTIIDNRATTDVNGTFDGLAEGAQVVVDGITFSISYVGGDGNDVVLTALNTGSDPTTPNTGVHRFVAANPIVLAALGALSAGLLIAIALRRKSTRS